MPRGLSYGTAEAALAEAIVDQMMSRGVGQGSGFSDATASNQASQIALETTIKNLLSNQILTALNEISIDADTVNLNTDGLEALVTAVRDRLVQSGDRIKTEANIRYLTDADVVSTISKGATTSTVTSVNAAMTTTPLLVANTLRKGAIFFNNGTGTLLLKLGEGALTTSYTVKVPPQVHWPIPMPYAGSITGYWEATGGAVFITELS